MEVITRILDFVISFTLFVLLLACNCTAQSPSGYTIAARQLDSLLQDYAYRAFDRPRTGTPYDGAVPSNIAGIKVAVLRLRCGSLRTRGFQGFKEFNIPTGVIVHPYAKRLAFVYQNLGNLSSFYYPLQGYTFLAPVIGLLAYNAANLTAIGLPELDIIASNSPISIKFTDVRVALSGFTAKCVKFDLNGTTELTDLISGNVCSTFRQGHFSIVVNSSVAPSHIANHGKEHRSKIWKIVVSVVGGLVGLFLLVLLVAWLISYRKKKKFREMRRREEAGVVLQMGRVGDARVPIAPMARTQPVIENDYVP